MMWSANFTVVYHFQRKHREREIPVAKLRAALAEFRKSL